MKTTKITEFKIIGISVRTTNENGQATKDIPFLWNKFFTENIISQIPNKINADIYCVYTDYVKDYTQPYTTIIGCKVENLDNIPDGLVGKSISTGNYISYKATGKLSEGIVYKEWLTIWNADIDRIYSADFDVYGQKSQNTDVAEVDILISIK